MSIITDYLTENITITPKGTLQANGKYAFDGTAVETRARVLDKKIVEFAGHADQVVYDRAFWIAADETIAVGDRITWSSINHEVMDIRRGSFLVGGETNHFKVMVRM